MATDSKILREYLVALGFKVQRSEWNKLDTGLIKTDKIALGLGKTLLSAASSATAMVTLFARSMEKLYYSSKYAETTAENLQTLEYGARQIGLEGGRATMALKNMTAAMRANPGLKGLLDSLGVKSEGRDKSDVLLDLVGALKKMPASVGMRYAGLFGIDQETLFYLENGLDKLKEMREQRKQMADDMGLDADKAAETGVEYMRMWREVTERAGMFGQVILGALLPYTRELVSETDKLLIKWAHIVGDMQKPGGNDRFMKKLREGLGMEEPGEGRVTLSADAKRRLGLPEKELPFGDLTGRKGVGIPRLIQDWQKWRDRKGSYGLRPATDVDAVDAAQDLDDFKGKQAPSSDAGDTDPGGVDEPGWDPQQHLRDLEKKYKLPAGLLDRVWNRESSRGKNMLSPAGAKGHFGFMPKTASEYGIFGKENDFTASSEAAARKYSDLLRQYNGDVRKAAAAYNLGDGKLARYGMSNLPAETRGYVDAVAGGINQTNNFHIYGSGDAQKTADLVMEEQRTANSDIVRNNSPRVR
jgi:hypothetical protein